MKTIVTCLALFVFVMPAISQELASKDGVTLAFEATKTETTKKADKWNIRITINNTTGSDLYFVASPGPASNRR